MKRFTANITKLVLVAGLAASGITSSIEQASAAELRKKATVKTHQAVGAASGIGGFTTGFNLNCASGFSMAAKSEKNVSGDKWTDYYVCSTPVLQCPKQPQKNGLISSVHPKVVVQTVGGDPDGGTVKFRVQYKCDYGYTSYPEG
ncbi:MAG: hypothetical protein AAFS08_12500 [Pseudomonadota bacterium]